MALITLIATATGNQPAQAQSVVAATASTVTWPSTSFGPPSAINSHAMDAELGVETFHFANGARLSIKRIPLHKDQVSVQVLLGSGRAGLKPGQAHVLRAMGEMPSGGWSQRSLAESSRWFQATGKQLSVSLHADLHAFILVGRTRPADLLAQLQVLAAFAHDPGLLPELTEKLKADAPVVSSQQSDPSIAYGREVMRVLSSGDPRLADAASLADSAATRAGDLRAALREALASAADVVIVGDVAVESAISAMQATFGAGESRPRPPRAELQITPPVDGGTPHLVTHAGRNDLAVIGWHWPMPDHWIDPPLAATAKIAAAVLQARLVDAARSQLGIGCVPRAYSSASMGVAGNASFSAEMQTQVGDLGIFRQILASQMQDLAAQRIEEGELQQARQPLIEARLKALETHEYWSFWLAQMLREPRVKDEMLGEIEALERITLQQVQSFFRDGLTRRLAIEVIAQPRQR